MQKAKFNFIGIRNVVMQCIFSPRDGSTLTAQSYEAFTPF